MAPLKCCVTGCNATSASHCLYSFPKDDKLRILWLSFLLPVCPKLNELTKKQLLRKLVCQQHFDRYQMDGQGRRLRFAYPCLISPKEIAYGVPLNSGDYRVFNEHNYFQCQADDNRAEKLFVLRHAGDVYIQDMQASKLQDDVHIQNMQASELKVSKTCQISSCFCDITKPPSPASTPRQEVSSSVTNRTSFKSRQYMTQQNNIAKKSVKKSELGRANDVQSDIQYPDFMRNFNLLSKEARTLLRMQLKVVAKNKMARRFNMEEKLLALTLLKQSPKGYELLEKIFTLPNRRTLYRLAEKISLSLPLTPEPINA